MPRVVKFVLALALVTAVMVGVAASAANTQAAPKLGASITYNLFATDSFIKLADGTVQYMYGFVGGRQGVPLTFQNSQKAAVLPGGITSVPTGAPAPVAGAIANGETQFAGNAQFPAPLIYAAIGDVVEIRMKNLGVTWKGAPNDPHSIHLHGLDVDAANDGVPETSVGAVPANLPIPGAGNVVVYMFSPSNAGTYMYHCHQEADIHVQMGMYGALVVYNPTDSGAAGGPNTGGGTLHGWSYDKDYVMLLSEWDTRQHQSEQMGWAGAKGFNPVNYQPQYWMINGLSFPNTIHVAGLPGTSTYNSWAEWIASHPGYDPLITGRTGAGGTYGKPGEEVLIRVINMGFETQPMHMHGYHGKIIGSDQRGWPWANDPEQAGGNFAFGKGLEKNTLTIGSGETYEWLVDFGEQTVNAPYAAGSQTRYFDGSAGCLAALGNPAQAPLLNTPVSNQLTACPAIPVPAPAVGISYVGGPTVCGVEGPPVPGATVCATTLANPLGTSQFFPFHNHDDYKATNNGVYPGGMFTMLVPLP